MKTKFMAITVVLALVLSLALALAGPVSAAPIGWNVAGTWGISFLEGASVVSTYTVTLNQAGNVISDTGVSIIPPGYTWTVAGSISVNTVTLTGTYTSGVTGTISLTGTIVGGSMSGTWSQVTTPGGSANGTWVSTSGQATPIFAPIYSSGQVQITGNTVAPTISVTAPGPFGFGQFTVGDNYATGGAITVAFTPGSDPAATWALQVNSQNDGAQGDFSGGKMYSWDVSNYLTNQMEVSLGSGYALLPGGINTGNSNAASGSWTLYALQNVTTADVLVGNGNYVMIVSLMATVTP